MRSLGHSSAAANCLLVGLDNDSMGQVREALAAEAALPNASIAFGDAMEFIESERPDVVIVGYGNSPQAALELAASVQRRTPNVTLVAMADRADRNTVLEAVRNGYKDFVVLPTDTEQLREVVRTAAQEAEDDEEKGTVVAVLGAKGGVGTTTLTTNLCAELAAIHTVLCVDFDFGMGDVASVYDIKVRDSLADLAQRADRLDERTLTSSVTVHKSKVHVLPVPENINMRGEATPEELYTNLNLASKAYHYVFLDCGSHLDDAVSLGVQAADLVLLVTTPDIVSVRDALRRIRMMQALDIPLDRIRLSVNKQPKRPFVSADEMKENLGIRVSATISDDPTTFGEAAHEGKLIRQHNKKSDAAREIGRLVGVLTDDGPDDATVKAEGGGFFASLFGRG